MTETERLREVLKKVAHYSCACGYSITTQTTYNDLMNLVRTFWDEISGIRDCANNALTAESEPRTCKWEYQRYALDEGGSGWYASCELFEPLRDESEMEALADCVSAGLKRYCPGCGDPIEVTEE